MFKFILWIIEDFLLVIYEYIRKSSDEEVVIKINDSESEAILCEIIGLG